MAIENEYPPLLWEDTPQAEIVALREQVRQLTDHNSELLGVLAAVRRWAEDGQRLADNRLAQGTMDPVRWQTQQRLCAVLWEIVKPVE